MSCHSKSLSVPELLHLNIDCSSLVAVFIPQTVDPIQGMLKHDTTAPAFGRAYNEDETTCFFAYT